MSLRISHDKSRIGKEKKNKTLRAPDEIRNKTQTQNAEQPSQSQGHCDLADQGGPTEQS